MIFAKVGVDVYTHPRFIEAGFEASGYWMHALAYLRHHESSDGFLAERFITVPLAAKKAQCRRLCERLVSVGLFEKVEGGYFLVRYAEKNDTKNVIELNRAAARDRHTRVRGRSDSSLDDSPSEVAVTRSVTRHADASVLRAPVASVTPTGGGEAPHSHSHSHSSSNSDFSSASPSGSDFVLGGVQRGGQGKDLASPGSGDASPARRSLPPSERAMSGSYWLAAFTEGITTQTGRPCTAGRMYIATLERIVEHHAPERDAARACAWLREEANAFAAKWDGKHPPKGLTPDGLERWLNEGRVGPPEFGKPKMVQLPPEEWKPDDYSDLGAVMVTAAGQKTPNGKAKTDE